MSNKPDTIKTVGCPECNRIVLSDPVSLFGGRAPQELKVGDGIDNLVSKGIERLYQFRYTTQAEDGTPVDEFRLTREGLKEFFTGALEAGVDGAIAREEERLAAGGPQELKVGDTVSYPDGRAGKIVSSSEDLTRGFTPLNATAILDSGRRYLPTLADLVDRLTIVQQKMIFIPENAAEYVKERADIEHDIDLILQEKEIVLTATDIHAICMIQLTNRFIWENESKARAGGADQDKLLKLTHSINGVRNTAKNALSRADSGRKDYKIDALAADLPAEFGNWKVFGV